MKKKPYLQPDIEVVVTLPHRLMVGSPGWAIDGNPPTSVEQEDEVDDDDKLPSSGDLWSDDDGYGGFLDLD
ncbi:MAG: hypothetical protein J5506_10270 [Prevotella sp.]|nr:hypothetical protein [Prevotella sp.]